jgi:hypothetical protein
MGLEIKGDAATVAGLGTDRAVVVRQIDDLVRHIIANDKADGLSVGLGHHRQVTKIEHGIFL